VGLLSLLVGGSPCWSGSPPSTLLTLPLQVILNTGFLLSVRVFVRRSFRGSIFSVVSLVAKEVVEWSPFICWGFSPFLSGSPRCPPFLSVCVVLSVTSLGRPLPCSSCVEFFRVSSTFLTFAAATWEDPSRFSYVGARAVDLLSFPPIVPYMFPAGRILWCVAFDTGTSNPLSISSPPRGCRVPTSVPHCNLYPWLTHWCCLFF